MRKTVAVLAAAMLGGTAPAIAEAANPDTTALRNAVTRAEVLRYEQRLQAIGLSNENKRDTASTGNWESLNYVIGELRKMGLAVLLAEQNHRFAAQLCDRYVVLASGEIAGGGDGNELQDAEHVAHALMAES